MINQLVSRNSEILDKSRHHLKILMILIKEAIIQPSDHLQFVSFPFIDTSEYGCFVTFDVLLVDIGMRFPLGHIQTKFKYSDKGYPSICRYCICIQVHTMF